MAAYIHLLSSCSLPSNRPPMQCRSTVDRACRLKMNEALAHLEPQYVTLSIVIGRWYAWRCIRTSLASRVRCLPPDLHVCLTAMVERSEQPRANVTRLMRS